MLRSFSLFSLPIEKNQRDSSSEDSSKTQQTGDSPDNTKKSPAGGNPKKLSFGDFPLFKTEDERTCRHAINYT